LSLSRILSALAKPAVRESGGDFFRYTDAEKILPLARCAWTGHVWPDKIFQAMGALRFVSVPILPRPSPWLRTDPGQTCPVKAGRDEVIKLLYHGCDQSSFPKQSMRVLWLLL
jgi:hypothetical protein